MRNKLSLLVLSCDKYSDLWLNFFKARDKYWPDCEFDWYLVTETCNFSYDNVNVINTSKKLNWTGRLRYAIEKIKTPYIGWYLDDFYISDKVDSTLIHGLLERMVNEHINHVNMSDVFDNLIKMPEPHIYYDEFLFKIPPHKKYGISTAAAIWEKEYLLKILGDADVNAWQFEIDLCNLASTDAGLPGIILCDERKPFKVTPVPVVIQGKYYPPAIKYFAQKGIIIDYSSRGLMKQKDVVVYNLNTILRNSLRSHPAIGRSIKWIAKKIFRVKFFT